jgi:dihydropteroate synthase
MSDIEAFKQSVETFLSTHGWTATRFGRDLAGDPQFVFDLRDGREPRTDTRQRIIQGMARYAEQVEEALAQGLPPERVIIDPGHDLNKNTYHSLALTRRLPEITSLGYPTLVAVSNKDFIGETLNLEQGKRVEGTLAALTICVLAGARIVRVHNVAAAVSATRLTEAVLGLRAPATTRHNLD